MDIYLCKNEVNIYWQLADQKHRPARQPVCFPLALSSAAYPALGDEIYRLANISFTASRFDQIFINSKVAFVFFLNGNFSNFEYFLNIPVITHSQGIVHESEVHPAPTAPNHLLTVLVFWREKKGKTDLLQNSIWFEKLKLGFLETKKVAAMTYQLPFPPGHSIIITTNINIQEGVEK